MARAKPGFPPREAILALADAQGRLALRVTPGARSESVECGDAELLLKVRSKPKDGEANQAVMKLLAEALGVAPSRIEMLRGATSRAKLVRIS